MKGKQLIDKIFNPTIIFASGVLIILVSIFSFVALHVKIVNKIEEININIDEINQFIFESLSEDNSNKDDYRDIVKSVNNLMENQAVINLLATYDAIEIDDLNIDINDRNDIKYIYTTVNNIKKIVHSHSIDRENSFRILYLLITLTVIIMILFLGIGQYESYKVLKFEKIRNETNNKLYDQLEKERSLIAFELHDDIAQKLAILKRYFSSKNSIDEYTNLMGKYSTEVIQRVRYLSRMLKAPDNPDVSFKYYLETLFSDFNVLSDFKLNRKTVGLNALKLKPSAALHIYRIIQEILTNSRIHSEATEIDLLLVYSHPTLNIKYTDNGKGFDPYLVYKKGIGLESIKYRLEILRGDYVLNSAEGEGTDISIDIPVELCEIS